MNWRPLPWGLRRVGAEFHSVVHEIAVQCRGSLISGLRTPEKNDSLQPASVKLSRHQAGFAEDYEFQSNDDRDMFVRMCLDAGFKTIPKNLACHVSLSVRWWLEQNVDSLRSQPLT